MFYFLKKMDREKDVWITALMSLQVTIQVVNFFYIKLLTLVLPIGITDAENELLSSLVISSSFFCSGHN